MSAPISCHHVSRWYGSVIGVSDISMEVKPGVTGLLGPNGAGKSTLMKVITGQLRPSQGEAKLFGEPVFGNPEALRRLGFSPEQDALYEDITVVEFVTGLLRLSGFSPTQAKQKTDAALELVDLAKEGNKRLGQFSKGMRQRAKLAQAIAHDPDVVVLDEPLNGLDPVHRKHMIELVQKLAEQGKAVLISSHVLHEVEAMTSEIRLIAKGRLLAEGSISDIRGLIDKHPHHISIECENARALASRMVALEHIKAVSIESDERFVVETFKPDACYDAIPEQAEALGLLVRGISSPDDSLAAVFRYLVG
jgi:ABC-2 type transport system ATP-binding protein